MECFQNLTFDWEGKTEPPSPSSQDPSFVEELILENYDYCNEGLFNDVLFDVIIDTKPVITSELMKDTTMVIALPPSAKVKKDQWLGEKLKVPQLVDAVNYVPSAPTILASDIKPFHLHQQQPLAKVQNSTELFDFDFEYNNVEITDLTPPQTPPQEAAYYVNHAERQFFSCTTAPQLLQQQQQQSQQQQHQQDLPVPVVEANELYDFDSPMNGLLVNSIQTIVQEPLQQVPSEYQLANSFGFQPVDEVENIARNLELVEEIVRSRSKDLPDCNEDDDSCSFSEAGSVCGSSSPMSDSSSSSSSYCGSAYSGEQDDEWSPSRSSSSSSSSKNNSLNKTSNGGVSKKRTRPYGRGVEDKKSRKKEQNKNAATRYRMKKKAEIEEILIEERKLKDQYEELKSKSADIGREIRYLKNLMREICKAKGLI